MVRGVCERDALQYRQLFDLPSFLLLRCELHLPPTNKPRHFFRCGRNDRLSDLP